MLSPFLSVSLTQNASLFQYAVLSVDIASHDLTRRGWSLMGERVWDAIVGIDVLAALPAVDETRLGTVGLSLGGEAVMYVAALDERVQAAISSGWVTTIENMKVNHCPCWNFDGLEEAFDFSDIFACVAPRRLVLVREGAPCFLGNLPS